jgi:HEAT repeat protein
MAHVFISYKREDKVFALELRQQLIDAGFQVWIDEAIRAGRKWRDEIDEKLRESFAVVLIVTSEAMKSEYVTYEWIFALGAGIEVVPLYLRTIEKFPYRLEDFQYVDFREKHLWGKLIHRLQEVSGDYHPQNSQIPPNAPSFVVQAATDLESTESTKRASAINNLVKSNHPSSLVVLISSLESHIPDVPVLAAIAVAKKTRYRDTRTIPKLLAAINHEDIDEDICEIALEALNETVKQVIDIDYEYVIPHLIDSLQDKIVKIRGASERILVSIGEPSIPYLVEALKSANEFVRISSADTLGCIADKGLASTILAYDNSIPYLADLVFEINTVLNARTKTPENISNIAVETLIKLGENTVPDFIRLLNDSNQEVRKYSVYALHTLASPAAVKSLLDTMRAENQYVNRDNIIPALESIGQPAVPILIEALTDSSVLIRFVAIWVLVTLDRTTARQKLLEFLNDTEIIPELPGWGKSDRRVCDVAAELIDKIGSEEERQIVQNWRASTFDWHENNWLEELVEPSAPDSDEIFPPATDVPDWLQRE